MMRIGLSALWVILAVNGIAARADGLYAVVQTSKGTIVARLAPDLAPMTVANFVGLAEGTIANAAFDTGRPFYDGTIFHRVVPGHVIQTGIPKSERAKNPGYAIPNEIDARLSHNHAGVLNMANSGPNTSGSQWCITLADRSYLDGDFNIFGEVVDGLDVVMKIAQGDLVESVRIERVGAAAEAFHPSTGPFRAMVKAAESRTTEHAEKKRIAEAQWIARKYPAASVTAEGVWVQTLAPANEQNASGAVRISYRGTEVRYVGHVTGRPGPALQEIAFASGETGLPGYFDEPRWFAFEAGKTKVGPNGVVDATLAGMRAGERKVVVIPAALGYGKSGFYPPEIPGQRRFAVSPNVLLVYEFELLGAR